MRALWLRFSELQLVMGYSPLRAEGQTLISSSCLFLVMGISLNAPTFTSVCSFCLALCVIIDKSSKCTGRGWYRQQVIAD